MDADFVKACLDEIALEGLDGITLATLWFRLTTRESFKITLDDVSKQFLWSHFAGDSELAFFALQTDRRPITAVNRYRNGETGVFVQDDPLEEDIYPLMLVDENVSGTCLNTRGSCSTYYTREDVTFSVKGDNLLFMTLDDVTQKWGDRLVIVASQRLRTNTIMRTFETWSALSVRVYAVLERIARSRYTGEITYGHGPVAGLTQCLNAKPKEMFYIAKKLVQMGLIMKQRTYVPAAVSFKATLLLHLKRFYVPSITLVQARLLAISQFLECQPDKIATYYMIRQAMPDVAIKKLRESMPEYKHYVTLIKVYVNDDGVKEELVSKKTKNRAVGALKLIKPYNPYVTEEDGDEEGDEEEGGGKDEGHVRHRRSSKLVVTTHSGGGISAERALPRAPSPPSPGGIPLQGKPVVTQRPLNGVDDSHDSVVTPSPLKGVDETRNTGLITTTPITTRDTTCNKACMRNHDRLVSLQHSCAAITNESVFKTNLQANFERLIRIKTKDPKTDLMYCTVYKIGSTFMTQVMAVLSGYLKYKTRNPFPIKLVELQKLPFNRVVVQNFDFSVFDNAFNVLIVRDPYSRLLSFYIDKLYCGNRYFWHEVGKIILKNTRIGGVGKSCGVDITFTEFLRHVVMTEKSGTDRNEHWYPIHKACKPCYIRYDYIGKIETLGDDINEVLRVTNMTSQIDVTNISEKNQLTLINETVDKLFDKNDMRLCMSVTDALKRVWNILKIKGVISHKAKIPDWYKPTKKSGFINLISATRKLYPMTKEEKRQMRYNTLQEAFRTVPMDVLNDIKQIYRPDFTLFGYDLDPDFIRNREVDRQQFFF